MLDNTHVTTSEKPMSTTRETGTKSAGADKGLRFTVPRSALLGAIARTAAVIERKNTIPILSYVLIRLRGGVLEMVGTDMEIGMISRVSDVSIQREGTAVLPASTLLEVVKKLPDNAEVVIDQAKADASDLSLTAGRFGIKLNTLDPSDFPSMVDGKFSHTFGIAAETLRDALDRVSFAMSNEETRYYLNGIYIHATKSGGVDVLRAVATDGHRLARLEMPLPDGAAKIPGVILPRKTVMEVRKLIDETAGAVQVSLSDTRVRFAFGDAVLVSKLIDGAFPDYERVIPSGNDKTMEVDRKLFAAAVDRVATISTEKSRAVKLAATKGLLSLTANSPDAGTASEEIEVSYQGPAIEIGFNARYLLDIAEQIEGENATFKMADAASPTVVADAADPSALYVLMPMRV
jgi:DNA polymerase-3 subunit beta